MRILIVEDEKEIADGISGILKMEGFISDAVYDGEEGLDYILTGTYDLVLLDVMLPGLDGFEIVKRAREEGVDTPVIMLTAKSQVSDKIQGLDLGADDYLPKPFDMGELLARVRAMLRRKSDFSPVNLTCGNLTLDRNVYELFTPDHDKIRLAGREFQMMEMLMDSPGRIISVDTFMSHIWADGEADVNVVWVYISNLRKKILSLGATCEIKASRGVGYSINELDKPEL